MNALFSSARSPSPRGVPLRLGRRGAAAIEFALVGGVLVTILMAIMVYGMYMWSLHALQYAADQGSLYVYSHPTDDVSSILSGAKSAAESAAATLGLTATVTTTQTTLSSADAIEITASYSSNLFELVGLATTNQVRITVPIE